MSGPKNLGSSDTTELVRRRRWEFPFASMCRNKSLVWELSKRDVLGRYRGASFGLAWSVISPFLMLGVYAYAFGEVMQGRWPRASGGGHPYAIILFVGLIIHGFVAECLSRAPTLIVSNPNFVKRVVFPLDVLPWPMVLSALFHSCLNICVLAILILVVEGHLYATMLLLPFILLPLVVTTLGVSWFLAAFGVYFRDINQIMPVVVTALLFLSSAIVPVSTLTPKLQVFFRLNPLTFFIDQTRVVVLIGHAPDWWGLAAACVGGLLTAWIGHAWFMATQRGFADVL